MPTVTMPPKPPAPDCNRCRHHYITHAPQFPYGCRAHGFKSQRKPMLDVLEASGTPCLAFQAKAALKKEKPGT